MFLQYSKHVLCVERNRIHCLRVGVTFFVFHKSNDLCDEMVDGMGPPRVYKIIVVIETFPRIFQTFLSANVLLSLQLNLGRVLGSLIIDFLYVYL